ncbi:MAG: ribulokinase [Verrucomicrobiales bacterium]|nr:ribulokinase [Verrucomicrobiales bacterium]
MSQSKNKSSPRRPSTSSRTYVLGIDFGTLSGRALLVDAVTGEEVATAVHEYRHGSVEERLPGSTKRLPPEFALQHPGDYLEVLERTIPRVLADAGVRGEQVLGIGTDFTSCTMLPTRADGRPLCFETRWRREPHAWVKLWKHHAAQPEADHINAVGLKRKEEFIRAYGGRYSSEWFFSKLLETVRQAPEVYDAADRFIEAGDWIVWQLCGSERRNLSAAGFKAMWVYPDGKGGWTYPSEAFFRALHPKLTRVVAEKLGGTPLPLGACADGLTAAMAQRLGLKAGTPVAVGNIDAHVAVPACGVGRSGELVMIMGTSTCHLLVGDRKQSVEGACGVVDGGVVAGSWGYEAGQAGVGDLFAWYMKHGVPAEVDQQARQQGVDRYRYLETRAAALQPGESGLLALDWWNGCRSVLMDSELSGLLLGATLGTRPHEIYRAMIEATAFGTRRIIEAFTSQGVAIRRLVGCGGLAKKNPLLMQIYADVTGRPIQVASSEQACALGAAMHGAVAAGLYRDVRQAAQRMARIEAKSYRPNPKHKRVYDSLYSEYLRMHDFFGRDPQSPMKRLRQLRKKALGLTR